tara:strand:- start:307 stop:561 length:255 start_codon:yes stop_codon:yes gene_type:complete
MSEENKKQRRQSQVQVLISNVRTNGRDLQDYIAGNNNVIPQDFSSVSSGVQWVKENGKLGIDYQVVRVYRTVRVEEHTVRKLSD